MAVAIGHARDSSGCVVSICFGRSTCGAVAVVIDEGSSLLVKYSTVTLPCLVGHLGVEGFVFKLCCAFGRVGLFEMTRLELLYSLVVLPPRPSTISVISMRPVVFELPAEAFFAGLGHALEVPAFVRVFDDMFHRVFCAFD